jgi:DNA-binding MarR family transcriptional regulator
MTNTPTTEAPDSIAAALQSETLVQLLSRTYYDMLPMFERHVGMNRARWGVLITLRREGELSQADLQQRLRVDGAAITRQVKQLEEEGLVLRRADPQDNRYTLVTLSTAGQQLASGLVGRRESFEALVTNGISEADLATLRRCLYQIRANLAAQNDRDT